MARPYIMSTMQATAGTSVALESKGGYIVASGDYNNWDAQKTTSCICDIGYTGAACDMRVCAKGDDHYLSIRRLGQ